MFGMLRFWQGWYCSYTVASRGEYGRGIVPGGRQKVIIQPIENHMLQNDNDIRESHYHLKCLVF